MSKQLIIQGLKEVCETAYKLEESAFPKFQREAWNDQVTVARAIVSGAASAYDTALAAGFAGEAGVEPNIWAGDVLETNHQHVAARIGLAAVFAQASRAILSAPDEHLAPTIRGLEGAAIEAAKSVGSTPERDALLSKLITQWVEKSLASLEEEEFELLEDEEI